MKEQILKLILNISNLTKEEIVEELKQMIIHKNNSDDNLNDDLDLDIDLKNGGCVCMPSLCISKGNKPDVKIDLNSNVEL
jgi:hypothetical protein